jgi:hypothetical protein
LTKSGDTVLAAYKQIRCKSFDLRETKIRQLFGFRAAQMRSSKSMFRFKIRKPRINPLQRVATIATMPSRAETFRMVVERILPQVDQLFVFLDSFDHVPEFLSNNDKIQIARSQDVGDLHAAGRFLVLQSLKSPSVVIVVDDDIEYPRNYVSRLVACLVAHSGAAVVGVHGGQFLPPYQSYITDALRHHFASALKRDMQVDELGCGTCAFLSEALDFDVRAWPYYDANDLQIAMEAKKRGLPLVCIKRRRSWLRPYAEFQTDSNWTKTLADPSRKSALMRILAGEAMSQDNPNA